MGPSILVVNMSAGLVKQMNETTGDNQVSGNCVVVGLLEDTFDLKLDYRLDIEEGDLITSSVVVVAHD